MRTPLIAKGEWHAHSNICIVMFKRRAGLAIDKQLILIGLLVAHALLFKQIYG